MSALRFCPSSETDLPPWAHEGVGPSTSAVMIARKVIFGKECIRSPFAQGSSGVQATIVPINVGSRVTEGWKNPGFFETDSPSSCRSEEHTSELQSRGLISYAVFCLKKKKI